MNPTPVRKLASIAGSRGALPGVRRSHRGATLLVAGSAAFGLAMLLRPRGHRHASAVVYEPTDTLKPLAEGVWVVDSGPLYRVIPLRMTVIRLTDGTLLLHSPTPPTPQLCAELDALGRITALVAPNLAHWMSVPAWQRLYPEAKTWAAPGLRRRGPVRRSGMRIDAELNGAAPAGWGGALELVPVPGGLGFTEIALFHRSSRTLVLTDLVLNLEPQLLPWLARGFMRLVGTTAPGGRAPVYLRQLIKAGGPAARAAAARLVALRPDRVVFAHGRMLETDATAALTRSLGWLLPKEPVP